MKEFLRFTEELPEEQKAVRAKSFHPSGIFIEFKKEEIEQSIPERFEKIVRQYPERLAVKTKDRSLTYGELNQAANRIARAILAKRGQGSEPIALLFEHGIDVIAAIFGTLKAGKFYVALDPSFPLERIRYTLSDSRAGLIVTNNRNLGLARELIEDTRPLLSVDDVDASRSVGNPNLRVSPTDIAAVMYTSGSTGEPKGVIVTHRYRLDDAMIFSNEVRICAEDRLSLVHPVSFASAKVNLFGALLIGASLFPFDIKSEGIDRLAAWLKDERITIFHSAPAVFRQLAESICDEESLVDLRIVHLSGAPITEPDVALYKKKFASRALLEFHMGATETGYISSAVVDSTFTFPTQGVPVGYPCPGRTILLFDESGHEIGAGQVGEIAVKSSYLASGYWKSPQLSQARFLPDPTGGDARIYLTGDLGRMLPDGCLIHLGRKDFQLKIRGYRVEIAEIERALLAHPGVKEAAVIAWDREPGEKRLVAYVVPRQEPAPTIGDLHEFVRGKLPDYMTPSAFVFLKSLPLTNGKLDRGALPLPDHQRPEMRQLYVQPRTEIEQKLAQIWQDVLDIGPVGIHDSFLELGGHSLLATQVISRVREACRIELSLRSFFETPTVAAIADVIQQARESGAENLPPKIARVPRQSQRVKSPL